MTIGHLNMQGLGGNAAGFADYLEDKEIDVVVVLDVQQSWVDATGRTNRSYRVVRADPSSAAWVSTRIPVRRVERRSFQACPRHPWLSMSRRELVP